jgi:choline transporter-like protein 2/4/5
MGSQDTLGTLIYDFQTNWIIIVYMFLITLVITLVYVYLLRWIAKPLIYISLVLIVLALIGGGGYLFYLTTLVEEGSTKQTSYYVGAGIIWVFSLLVIIFICCQWKNMQLGAAIFQASSDFLSSHSRLILMPLLNYVVLIPLIGAWLFFMLHVASIGTPVYVENSYIATM